MANLPTIKRVQRTDLGSDVPNWVDGLLSPINQFMEEIYSALNKDLSIPENIKGQIIKINFKTQGGYASSKDFQQLTFLNTIKKRFNALWIGSITKIGEPQKKFDAIFISWYDNNDGTVSINYISGLENNSEYNITLIGV